MKVLALLFGSAAAIQRHHHHHRPSRYAYFATGMNGDEDLGQDITMKGEKFHYAQDHSDARLLQVEDVNGSWVDANFKPHPVLPDPTHKDRVNKIQSVAGPDVTDQIGATVHEAAMAGGDANPMKPRDGIIGNYPMFSYPKKQTPDPAEAAAVGNGAKLGDSDAPAITVEKKAVDAAKEKRASEADAERAAEKLKEAAEPRVEGIEANRIAATKKMEANTKKDKVMPPATTDAPVTTGDALAQRK